MGKDTVDSKRRSCEDCEDAIQGGDLDAFDDALRAGVSIFGWAAARADGEGRGGFGKMGRRGLHRAGE